ncbi:MAG: MoaD/ThiS family protein [Chloroflexi bacterium]|nr:MoaD/ThiS family protein [Chloroflexota bacterium]
MSVSLKIPTPLRRMTNGESTVDVDGTNLMECIDSLDAQYPGIKERLVSDNGELHRFVNVYVNGEDIRFIDGIKTPIKTGDEVSIVPAVAGG